MRPEPKTFLSLPADVRLRIYSAAGLILGAHIFLDRERTEIRRNHEFLKPGFTYRVLRTSKAIYSEVKSLIYTKNSLVPSRDDPDYCLEFLLKLQPQDCSDLRDLYVCLKDDSDYRFFPLNHERITKWQAAAEHVLSNAKPGMLTLHLMCDSGEDSEVTSAVLKPLLGHPGILADCELRLSHNRDYRLSSLALEVATRAKVPEPNPREEQPFPFLQLPTEIRQEILRYTDLVTPNKQVLWDPIRGFNIFHSIWDYTYSNGSFEAWKARRYRYCEGSVFFDLGSFCCSMNSASSSRCKCWVVPRSLMLVSRTVYEDACCVFYSSNRFIIVPTYAGGTFTSQATREPPTRLQISRFITRYKRPEILRHLRRLEIVFPTIDSSTYPKEGDRLYSDWSQAVDVLKTHANISNLEITIHMLFYGSKTGSSSENFILEMKNAGNDTAQAFRVHTHLLEPLKSIRRMKSLFVHLEWTWYWPVKKFRAPQGCEEQCGTCESCRIGEIETWLERIVMGDEYDSFAEGKALDRPSDWLYSSWMDRVTGFGWDDIYYYV